MRHLRDSRLGSEDRDDLRCKKTCPEMRRTTHRSMMATTSGAKSNEKQSADAEWESHIYEETSDRGGGDVAMDSKGCGERNETARPQIRIPARSSITGNQFHSTRKRLILHARDFMHGRKWGLYFSIACFAMRPPAAHTQQSQIPTCH